MDVHQNNAQIEDYPWTSLMFLHRRCTGTQCKWLCWRHTCSSWLPPCCNCNKLLSLDFCVYTPFWIWMHHIKLKKENPSLHYTLLNNTHAHVTSDAGTAALLICAVMMEQDSKYLLKNRHLIIWCVYDKNLVKQEAPVEYVLHIYLLHSNFRSMRGLQADPMELLTFSR